MALHHPAAAHISKPKVTHWCSRADQICPMQFLRSGALPLARRHLPLADVSRRQPLQIAACNEWHGTLKATQPQAPGEC